MCGIAGYINLDKSDIQLRHLTSMAKTLTHRGPDDTSHWIDKNVGIAHTRLSIIDLSSKGMQPMISNSGRDVLSYNGEIYNFKKIKKKLELIGYQFKSKTDSEVILAAWQEWQEKSILYFNGMFAFVIYDIKLKQLFLVRDRYGIKPIYYLQTSNGFYFGSEQKSIFANPNLSKNLNFDAILEYMTFQNIFTEQTFFKNCKILKAGHYAKFNIDNKKFELKKYWDFNFESSKNKKITYNDYEEELDRLIKQAVSRQLISDVEVGSYLSGGMDSGTLAAFAVEKNKLLKTFTVGFDLSTASGIELVFDERYQAEAVSGKLKTEHYEIILKSGDLAKCLDQLSYHIEEPRVGQSYPNYYASKLASKFVKVVLSGSGGDEIFGGYPWRYFRPNKVINIDDYVNKYFNFWQRLMPNTEINKLLKPILSQIENTDTKNIFKETLLQNRNDLKSDEDFINQSMYFEAKTFLHGILVVEDKLSMAHSLETRVPFLDNDLVDFALKCPLEFKIKNIKNIKRINENEPTDKVYKYIKKTNDGKNILRKMMSKKLPFISKLPKQGFVGPDSSWYRGESMQFVKEKLLTPKTKIHNIFDKKIIKSNIDLHLSGKENKRLLIWSLLNLESILENQFS